MLPHYQNEFQFENLQHFQFPKSFHRRKFVFNSRERADRCCFTWLDLLCRESPLNTAAFVRQSHRGGGLIKELQRARLSRWLVWPSTSATCYQDKSCVAKWSSQNSVLTSVSVHELQHNQCNFQVISPFSTVNKSFYAALVFSVFFAWLQNHYLQDL